MRRVVTAVAAAVLASVVLSACGSSGAAPVSVPQLAPGAIVLVAGGPSDGFGVNNTELLAATSSGQIRDLTSSPAAEKDAAWSADGSHVVFVRESTTGQKNREVAFEAGVYVWSPGHGTPQRIASCSEVCTQGEFTWSPDDRKIAFVSDANVYGNPAVEVMNADGSALHTICDRARCGWGLAKPLWSPDSRKLVFSNEGGVGTELFGGSPPSPIWLANADGSGLEQLTHPNCKSSNVPCGWGLDTSPTWSPNGRLIAFVHYNVGLAPTTGPCGPGGLPPSRRRVRRCAPPIATSVEVMRPDGSHRHGIYRCGGESCSQTFPLAWAPDGKAIAFEPIAAHDSSVRITTLAGTTTRVGTCSASHCLHPAELTWSPNGKQLAFSAGGSPQTSGVWVMGRNGEAMRRVAAGGQCCLAWVGKVSLNGAKAIPRLTPGGHVDLSGAIVYGTPLNARRPLNLLSFGAAGAHAGQVGSATGKEPTLSPNGSEIAFAGTIRTDYAWHILVADRNGKHVRLVTDVPGTEPAWSPDGRTIAFTRETGGPRRWIALVPAAGGPVRYLTGAGSEPSWSPSGSELVFQRRVASGEALFTVRPDGRGLRRLTNLPGEQGGAAWSPDGNEIAFEWWTPSGTGLYVIRPDGTHIRRITKAALPEGRPAWSPDGRYIAVISDDGARADSRILVVDVGSGRVATVATVPGRAADPSWSSR